LIIINKFLLSCRRRHTRSKRDWSSDVCSSDLPGGRRRGGTTAVPRQHRRPPAGPADLRALDGEVSTTRIRSMSRTNGGISRPSRSEERREGNERWSWLTY